MPESTVLVIEDEPQIRHAVRRALIAVPATTLDAATGEMGIEMARVHRPDAIILDLGLPDIPGIEVCQTIREWSRVPLLVLSARTDEPEKVALLNAGADDYVAKPFSTDEFAARVRAQLRRSHVDHVDRARLIARMGSLHIDLASRVVTREGSEVRLTRFEWDLLRTFILHQGRTLTHQQLFDAVWRRGHGNAQHYLRVHVANLRRKIELNPAMPELIVTESGVGYRLAPDIEWDHGSRSLGTESHSEGLP